MNSELCKKALEMVGNPNILVNLISRRVRQLNSDMGGASRPLILNAHTMGAADVALTELLEGKMGYDVPDPVEVVRPTPKKRKRH